MWVPQTFEIQLNELVSKDIIHEIIIINNKKDKTPNWNILASKKIRLIDQENNIYVNPAWNLGVQLAESEFICLLNDDILFNTIIFDAITPIVSSHESGLYGLNMFSESDKLKLTTATERCWGFGCLMIMKRENYNPIPDNLKILYGDDYLFHMNLPNCWFIDGLGNNRVTATTCCSDYNTQNPDLPRISKEEHEWFYNWRTNR